MISPEKKKLQRAQVFKNATNASARFGFEIPKTPIDFKSPEGLNRILKLHTAGYSHSVMAILLGSRRKAIQHFLYKLRKEAERDGLSDQD